MRSTVTVWLAPLLVLLLAQLSVSVRPPLGGDKHLNDCPVCEQFTGDLCGNATGVEKLACEALNTVCEFIVCPTDNWLADHMPVWDEDGDLFSTSFSERGYAWRGIDCWEGNADVYPGRAPQSFEDPDIDANCNQIFGANESGSFEELFCENSGARGLIVLGDSTDAHFGVDLLNFNPLVWADNLLNELDWPACAWGTGWAPLEYCQPTDPSITQEDSFALRMFARNRCNFLDFQNIAVDGARSGPMTSTIVVTTARNASVDKPALVIYAEVANDVCNPHPNTLDHMTTPSEYYTNVMGTLEWLDDHLPVGSHVLFLGYLHGELMWETMANASYPYFGITYAELWHELSTHFVGGADNRTLNPCYGWLTPNATLRAITTQRARELEQVYQQIMANNTFKSFDMYYLPHPDKVSYDNWVAAGKNPVELYEIVGGGHPSQTASILWAETLWNNITADPTLAETLLGPVNPYNDEIAARFTQTVPQPFGKRKRTAQ